MYIIYRLQCIYVKKFTVYLPLNILTKFNNELKEDISSVYEYVKVLNFF